MNPVPGDKNLHMELPPFEMHTIIEPALEEILGKEVLSRFLVENAFNKMGNPLDGGQQEKLVVDVNSLQQSLEELFGQQAGSGLTLQVGRASFKYLLQRHGSSLGFSSMSFRLLPLSRKIDEGSQAIVKFLSEATPHTFHWEKTEKWYSCQITYGSSELATAIPEPICMFVAGLLQETFSWMSAGRTYKLEEKCCHDPGKQVCTIRIGRNPID